MDILRIRSVIQSLSLIEKIELTGSPMSFITRPNKGKNIYSLDLGAEQFLNEKSLAALGCTFNRELAFSLGKISADRARDNGEALAAVINIGVIREPMKKGAEKMISEDAFAVSEMAESFIGGAEGRVAACGILGGENKFCERYMDGRALNEIYLKPFITLSKKLLAVIIPAGLYNGEIVNESKSLISLITSQMKDLSMVFCEPFSVLCRSNSVSTGFGFQLCDNKSDKFELMRNIENGKIPEQKINNILERYINFVADYFEEIKKPAKPYINVYDVNKVLAKESIVLLKNENNFLPLNNSGENKIAAIGDINENQFLKLNKDGKFTLNKKAESETAILFAIAENGGISRRTEIAFKEAFTKYKKIIAVVLSPRAAELNFVNSANAVFYVPEVYDDTFSILSDMVSGVISPSGKLNISWAEKSADYPANRNQRAKKRGMFCYESVYNGYRYFSSFNAKVLYPFGHGLSYSLVKLTGLKLTADDDNLYVDFIVDNGSDRAAERVLFAFDRMDDSALYGLKMRLIGFTRVVVPPLEQADVRITVKKSEFTAFDSDNNRTVFLGGRHTILVGHSSENIILKGDVKLPKESKINSSLSAKNIPSYFGEKDFNPLGVEIEKVMKTTLIAKPHNYIKYVTVPDSTAHRILIKKCKKRLSKTAKKGVIPDLENISVEALEKIAYSPK